MKLRKKKSGTRLMSRPEEGKNPSRGVFTRRALLLMAAQGAVLGALGERLYGLQVLNGSHYAKLAESNRLSKRFFAPPRGRITDRFGISVAANRVNWRALLLAEETSDIPGTLERFAQLVPLEPRDTTRIEHELRHKRRFIPIMLRDFLSWDDMARLELNMPSLPGVLIDVGTTRVYPFGPLLAHVVGYVAPPAEKDVVHNAELALPGMRVGRSGIEQTQDNNLRGQVGSVEMEVNAVGRVMAELDRDEGLTGDEITLTIDSGLQQQVLGHIADQSASAVVMDCRNGEVLAMVSNPSFDPALFDSGVSQAQWVEWTNNSQTPLINKAVSGCTRPVPLSSPP